MDVDLTGTNQIPFISVVQRLQAAIYTSVDHSTYTAGVEVMNGLNRRDETPARAVAPFVFASVLDIPTLESGTDNTFCWFGKTPAISSSRNVTQMVANGMVPRAAVVLCRKSILSVD